MSRRAALAAAAALAAGPACAAPKLVRFRASDGVRLAADYIPPKAGRPSFVLIHGVAAGRGEWSAFARRLSERGMGSLALDLRGHGQSVPPDYRSFRTDQAWGALALDVRAAVAYLRAHGAAASGIGLAGGSIGANLAAQEAARDPGIACVALLSPGVEHRGIEIDQALSGFSRPVLLAASPEDRYAFESVAYLRTLVAAGQATVLDGGRGHGAQMLSDEFMTRLADWMQENCGAKQQKQTRPSPRPSP